MRVANSEEPIELPITVEVRDNGPGVPADLVEALFEPFVTTKAKGGLGLALVAKLVADHGGIVSHLATEAGTVFRVRLPAAARASRRDAAEACG
jgi:two-component system nitrogen regulation sensor histidine kinase GlnL